MIGLIRKIVERRRLLAQRKVDSDRARQGHETRIHKAYQNDRLINEMKRTTPERASASSTLAR